MSMHYGTPSNTSETFWSLVNKNGPTAPNMDTPCWLWQGRPNNNGYGLLRWGGKRMLAHRAGWEIQRGPIPPGEGYHGTCVLHKCDTPLCVRADHLFLGTQQDNIADRESKGRNKPALCGDDNWTRKNPDKVARGLRSGRYTKPERTARGEQNGSAKLTEAQVREIRERQERGETQASLSGVYGVSQVMIGNIVRRKSWKHVE